MVGGLFLGHSLIIIKLTWEFFPKNLQFEPPSLYFYGQKSTKKRNGICFTKITIITIFMFLLFLAFVNFEQISNLVLEFI